MAKTQPYALRTRARSSAVGARAAMAAPDRAKALPKIVKEAREECGLTQKQLAKDTGLSRTVQQKTEDPNAQRYLHSGHITRARREFRIAYCRRLLEDDGVVVVPAPADRYGEDDVTRVLAISAAAANVIRAGTVLLVRGPESEQLELFERECARVELLAGEGAESARRRLRAKRQGES